MELTENQIEKIAHYKKQYEGNLEEYDNFGSYDICGFAVYCSENPNDKNATIIMTTITGISDDYEPKTTINNIMVEPDGNSFRLTDIYKQEDVFGYIKKLKKIQ